MTIPESELLAVSKPTCDCWMKYVCPDIEGAPVFYKKRGADIWWNDLEFQVCPACGEKGEEEPANDDS